MCVTLAVGMSVPIGRLLFISFSVGDSVNVHE
jgi:hypothetical protein